MSSAVHLHVLPAREITSRAVSEESEVREPVAEAMERAPEADERIAGEKHPLGRMLLVGFVASVIGVALCLWIDWFPAQGVTAASQIDTLYDVLLICSVPVFVLVMTIVIYSVFKFRARPATCATGRRSTATPASR
jgi:hypothetical protein